MHGTDHFHFIFWHGRLCGHLIYRQSLAQQARSVGCGLASRYALLQSISELLLQKMQILDALTDSLNLIDQSLTVFIKKFKRILGDCVTLIGVFLCILQCSRQVVALLLTGIDLGPQLPQFIFKTVNAMHGQGK